MTRPPFRRQRARFTTCLALAGAVGLLGGCSADGEFVPLTQAYSEKNTLTVGGTDLVVETATDPTSREQGLKNRMSLPLDAGMLFVFPGSDVRRIWMKDVFIPLSVAFLDASGRILNIEDMDPFEEVPGAVSHGKATFALEANVGWFQQHGVRAGDVIDLPDWVHELDVE